MRLAENSIIRRNPGASQDLVIGVNGVCPVGSEKTRENARLNSLRDLPWIDEVPPHDGIACVVGKAPSVSQTIDDIKGTVFACNSASKYLRDKGVSVDYQVFLDPHPVALEELDVGAKKHLLASICEPEMFDRSNPVLWHPLMGWIEEVLPESHPPFTWIGGGITVGNSAICLAYTMGFRDIRVHGMDSSFDNGSQYVDGANVEDLIVDIEECGHTYKTAWYLKQQTVVFLRIAELLKQNGCALKVFGTGLLPDMFKTQLLEETKCSQVM